MREKWDRKQSDFNPHSPRGERRYWQLGQNAGGNHFNPHSPRGERRSGSGQPKGILAISIHTPREGSDRS